MSRRWHTCTLSSIPEETSLEIKITMYNLQEDEVNISRHAEEEWISSTWTRVGKDVGNTICSCPSGPIWDNVWKRSGQPTT
eukprot:4764966-Amphidinium_carterae.1